MPSPEWTEWPELEIQQEQGMAKRTQEVNIAFKDRKGKYHSIQVITAGSGQAFVYHATSDNVGFTDITTMPIKRLL